MMNEREQRQFDRIPAKYRHMVVEVEYDAMNAGDMGRWWVYAEKGWQFPTGTAPHTIHEDSWAECMKQIRKAVPCTCESCKA